MPRSSASKKPWRLANAMSRDRAATTQLARYQGRVEAERLVSIDEIWTKIDAPWFIEGPIDGVSFPTHVENTLLPVPSDPAISSSRISAAATVAKQFAKLIRFRRQAALPAKILARPEPDRTGFCQAQAPAPQGCRANRRRGLRRNRELKRAIILNYTLLGRAERFGR